MYIYVVSLTEFKITVYISFMSKFTEQENYFIFMIWWKKIQLYSPGKVGLSWNINLQINFSVSNRQAAPIKGEKLVKAADKGFFFFFPVSVLTVNSVAKSFTISYYPWKSRCMMEQAFFIELEQVLSKLI